MRGCGCICEHMYVNSIIYGIIWRRYCLSNVMYDCQGNMKETGRKGEAHMHAESQYPITYNDSSCMWEKKQGGKWERELERRRVRNGEIEDERDGGGGGGGYWRGMVRAGEKKWGRVEKEQNRVWLAQTFSSWTQIFWIKDLLLFYISMPSFRLEVGASAGSHQGWTTAIGADPGV